ncbi:MAG: hypothetical protein L0Y58_02145, partial [Verrucomicrobia subdivision 3 bacterium]|nr:hypothetical protein [Limisphaerales bacterium]
ETDRHALASDSYLVNRKRFILHPRGVRWIGAPAGASPTNAELATATKLEQGLLRQKHPHRRRPPQCLITDIPQPHRGDTTIAQGGVTTRKL